MPPSDMPEAILRSWLHLANIQFTVRVLSGLLTHFHEDPQAILEASDSALAEIPVFHSRYLERLRDPQFRVTDRQWNWVEKQGVQVVLLTSASYPRLLKEIEDPPPLLFVRGELRETDRFSVGMVGSRHATSYGKTMAERIAKDLAGQGLTVVSGGAVGIDAASHRGAMDGGGRTLAVLGCGLDVDYPRENRALFERIVEKGAILSEYPLGAQPEAWRFPQRNRLISGLSLGILVVEAPRQSGALITARYAEEHNRPVMVVPANIDRPTGVGSNNLLREGAVPILETQDILEALDILPKPARPDHQQSLALEARPSFFTDIEEGMTEKSGRKSTIPSVNLSQFSETERKLLEVLTLTPRHLDAVAREAGIDTTLAITTLQLLELIGAVRRLPGNTYIRSL